MLKMAIEEFLLNLIFGLNYLKSVAELKGKCKGIGL